MNEAEIIIWTIGNWLIVGAIVALLFLLFGIDRIDEDARGAYAFRPLIIPGILLIWPLVLVRWWVLESKKDNPHSRYKPVRKPHKYAAIIMCASVIVIIIVGLSSRQVWPENFVPVKLEASQ